MNQKTRNHGYDVIVGGELFTDYSECLANLSLNPNSNQRAPDATTSLIGGCLRKQRPERLLRKSGRMTLTGQAWRCL